MTKRCGGYFKNQATKIASPWIKAKKKVRNDVSLRESFHQYNNNKLMNVSHINTAGKKRLTECFLVFFVPTKPPNSKQLQFQKPNYSLKSKYESSNKRRESGAGEVNPSERHRCHGINLLTKLFPHFIWYLLGKKKNKQKKRMKRKSIINQVNVAPPIMPVIHGGFVALNW